MDVVLCVAAAVASFLALDQAHQSGLIPSYAGSALVAGVASATLLLRRSVPELTMGAALLSTLTSDDPTLMIFAAYAAAAYGGASRWLGVSLASLLYVLSHAWLDPGQLDPYVMAYNTIIAVWFPAAVGDLMRRRRELNQLLRRRLVAAEHAVELAARQAVLEERTRLAFDIHDGLGHRATVLTLQAGALRTSPGIPGKAALLAETVEQEARGILKDLRDILDVLRGHDDPNYGGARGGPAYAQFAESLVSNLSAAGIEVTYHRSGRAYPLTAAVDEVLRNCGREALTNAVKHGAGAPISLHLEFAATEVRLEVLNGPGSSFPLARRPDGLGLASMEERVARAGGRILARGTPDGGFRVHLALPRTPVPLGDGAPDSEDFGSQRSDGP
ncbi:histidine kinase [Streptomyces lavendulae]|uniref:sensor histidine kinase n=1 Tax=Streptomyces lavendulae TaxID=1914 RepID=UPI0033D24205